MTINELRQLTFFRHADIRAINEDNNENGRTIEPLLKEK